MIEHDDIMALMLPPVRLTSAPRLKGVSMSEPSVASARKEGWYTMTYQNVSNSDIALLHLAVLLRGAIDEPSRHSICLRSRGTEELRDFQLPNDTLQCRPHPHPTGPFSVQILLHIASSISRQRSLRLDTERRDRRTVRMESF